MSDQSAGLRAIYVFGETKTGKGVAGKAINEALISAGHHVYYDIAGDFFRRYVALARGILGLSEDDYLPESQPLRDVAQQIYDSRQAYDLGLDYGDLQRPAISLSVALLSELPIVQKAANEWFAASVRQARKVGADVLLLDGRKPRHRIETQVPANEQPHIALDLCLVCSPEEAAGRMLHLQGISSPSDEQLATVAQQVEQRRQLDRKRPIEPYTDPQHGIAFTPSSDAVAVIAQSWQPAADIDLPRTIIYDNSGVEKPVSQAAVSRLALAAVEYLRN